ncbi:PTS system mannose/fructose/N-acetylgalactosamine-transporter subunit IIB [Dielma fastidiosa]|uniref:PTS system mannose/fructose/N-acetylgalactosamine-transporter subunit IIB n=1 Tax=Dielma fastidiosa TaxID=1034346 RepID=UPI000E4A058A|nr:PTS sugar transporter subunit IIB [Dielma fastidiosa]RHM99594.1 PTS mannose/fructose/sorbose transporter subunit IIB [Dielma fastidiosa]
MNINVFRIDDRLIHGQIVTKWIKDAAAKMIMVVDDKAAGDKTQQMILKFAVPSGIKLEILSKKDAVKRVNEDQSNTNVLMLVRNPKEANALVEMGLKIDRIIIGNISNSKSEVGRTKLLDYIYVEPGDVEAIRSLDSKGIKLEVKAIPEEKAKDPIELINKKLG